MATRSMIGILREDGVVTGIYCHFDGYIDNGVGQMLVEHWNDKDKVEELMKLGDLSVLGKTIGEKVDFYSFLGNEQCLAYNRDRGEQRRGPTRYLDRRDFVSENDFASYFYLFDGTEWQYSSGNQWWNLLRDYVKKSPEMSAG